MMNEHLFKQVELLMLNDDCKKGWFVDDLGEPIGREPSEEEWNEIVTDECNLLLKYIEQGDSVYDAYMHMEH